ncbi:universal stress protein [Psychroflexus sp. ALD_RP9]|uniref:universal stress protein n=1 Tax=Psychroflexus sp. ALD_RP9 TaxID=2777186 RepID=UPI001A8DB67B|nr:universal stress protein [Psychroflexus sp. ALD_RP9]QSS97686.1 universal stress protein [Psychroflexus sp. ALD_RP9]
MNKILVPTDFSEQANNALKVSAQIAKQHDCEIYLLHLLDLPLDLIDPVNEGVGNDLPEALFFMKLAHKRFTETFEAFEKELEGIKVHETVEFNEAFEGILEISKKHDCDMIVMGSNGAEGLKEIFVGSNTEKVVRHADIPVLVVKESLDISKIKSISFASSLKSSQKSTFTKAINLAQSFNAQLKLVYINTPENFKTTRQINERFEAFTEDLNLDEIDFKIYTDKSIEEGIKNYSEDINANMISIGTHGRKGISHFFNGSLSENLVNHSKRPVVTFKI